MAPHQATVNSQIKTCRDKSLNNVGIGGRRGESGGLLQHMIDFYILS